MKPVKKGRPPLLTPKVQADVCKAIRETKLSLADCARALGFSHNTLHDWIARGREQESGAYRDFLVSVEKARAQGSRMLLGRVAKAGKEPKHWQANMALLSVTEPQYSPKVRVVVEQELSAALERVTTAFAGEPELLERVLAALTGPANEETRDEE